MKRKNFILRFLEDTRKLLLRLSNIYWALLGTMEKVEKINEENIILAQQGNHELTFLLPGVFTKYYSGLYYATLWFKKRKMPAVSLGYDYNADVRSAALEVKKQIDDILSRGGIKTINLIGVSLGGVVARYYIEQCGGKEITRKLVTVFAPPFAVKEGEHTLADAMRQFSIGKEAHDLSNEQSKEIDNLHSVDQLAMYGTTDMIVSPNKYPAHNIPEKVKQIPVSGGHMMVIFDDEVIELAYDYLTK